MGFIGMLGLLLIVFFLLTALSVVLAIRDGAWKKAVIIIAGFILCVGLLYWGLIGFITSM